MPTVNAVLGRDLGRADIAMLERYGDPRRLLAAGKTRLTRLITAASNHHLGEDKAAAFLAAARAAVALYADSPAVAWCDLADALASEIRLLRAAETELARHADAREAAYQTVDPDQLT